MNKKQITKLTIFTRDDHGRENKFIQSANTTELDIFEMGAMFRSVLISMRYGIKLIDDMYPEE